MMEKRIYVPTAAGAVPVVSVVLPVYNGEKYLREAINSVLAQTFRNFELIMIDDGSTDASHQILEEYRRRDPRVRVVVRENRGLATTLNNSIDLARGLWVARMDQDDIALPRRFETQLKWLEVTGADICGAWVQRFGTSDHRIVRLRRDDDAIKKELLFCSAFAHPSVMMRTRLVARLRYDPKFEKAEDYDLWERAVEAGWKMTNVQEILLSYRVHPEQISSKALNRQQQQTQDIRRRYWNFAANSLQLSQQHINEILKIFESMQSQIDMNIVDDSFTRLLKHSHGESTAVVLEHIARLYIRVASRCPNIVTRWSRINSEFGSGFGLRVKCSLWIFSFFRIRADGSLFRQLRKIYIWRKSR